MRCAERLRAACGTGRRLSGGLSLEVLIARAGAKCQMKASRVAGISQFGWIGAGVEVELPARLTK